VTFALRWTAAGLAVALLGACSEPSAYEATAIELAATERVGAVAFAKAWKPVGTSIADALSDEDRVRGEFWLASCVNELAARFVPAPRDAVRALQITECMQARGWRLAICDAGADRC
jgi:hypothetical protein